MLYNEIKQTSDYTDNKLSLEEMKQNYSNAELLLNLNNTSYMNPCSFERENHQEIEKSDHGDANSGLKCSIDQGDGCKYATSPVLVINEGNNSESSSRALSPISIESNHHECLSYSEYQAHSNAQTKNGQLLLSSSSASTCSSAHIESSPLNAHAGEHEKLEDFNELSPSPSSDCLSSTSQVPFDQGRAFAYTKNRQREGSVCSQTSSGSSNRPLDSINESQKDPGSAHRKEVIPQRKRRDFIPAELKDEHYWERRRKNNLAAKRSREKRRLNDLVLETKLLELTNINHVLKLKLDLCMKRCNLGEEDMTKLFEENRHLLVVQENLDMSELWSNDEMHPNDSESSILLSNSPQFFEGIKSKSFGKIAKPDMLKNPKEFADYVNTMEASKSEASKKRQLAHLASSGSSFDDNFDNGDIESDESEHEVKDEAKDEAKNGSIYRQESDLASANLEDGEGANYPPSKKLILNIQEDKVAVSSDQPQAFETKIKSHFPLLYKQLCKSSSDQSASVPAAGKNSEIKKEAEKEKIPNDILNKLLQSPFNHSSILANSSLMGRLQNILSEKITENTSSQPADHPVQQNSRCDNQPDARRINQLMQKYKNLINKTNMSSSLVSQAKKSEPKPSKNTVNSLLQNLACSQTLVSSQSENSSAMAGSRKRHINQLAESENVRDKSNDKRFADGKHNGSDVGKMLQMFLQCAKEKESRASDKPAIFAENTNLANYQFNKLQSLNQLLMLQNMARSNVEESRTGEGKHSAQVLPVYAQNDKSQADVVSQNSQSQNSGDNMPLKLRFKMLQLKAGEVNS
ncbi:nuclear factor interleukin-3-regulated [Brachionus plicatilis]|uniref:Nuclear factor interleukin-3-regulated n=1 Tax=Brachionus plicatilis TaxID=10195 RepID=A0A3M7Q081_BRAPC|nr:nuclear factor interleukin-3-regulated [Brachionus plicatilis]